MMKGGGTRRATVAWYLCRYHRRLILVRMGSLFGANKIRDEMRGFDDLFSDVTGTCASCMGGPCGAGASPRIQP